MRGDTRTVVRENREQRRVIRALSVCLSVAKQSYQQTSRSSTVARTTDISTTILITSGSYSWHRAVIRPISMRAVSPHVSKLKPELYIPLTTGQKLQATA